jgi:hypothetical protein
MVFGLIRSGLNPTIYAARGEHTNHYTTDAVENAIVKNMMAGKLPVPIY